MKKALLPLVFILTVFQYALAQTPVLGLYANTIVSTAGGNATVTSSATPVNTTSITAYTSSDFKGLLHVNPVNGLVSVTNAHPAGAYTITVKAFNGLATDTVSFVLVVFKTVCSQALFGTPAFVTVGTNSIGGAIGDFNGDGKQDFATVNSGSHNVSVRLGNGAGSFSSATDVSAGNLPNAVAVGDFNGDGKQDLVIANVGSNNVSVRLGDGNGGFITVVDVPTGLAPQSITTGDYNSDGILDIATANNGSNSVSICFGNGSGGFGAATTVAVGNSPMAIVTSDFNNDGKPDLASANYNSNTVSIRIGNGSGGFTALNDVATGIHPLAITCGDFNADGKQDLAVVNNASFTVSIRLGDGAGNFSSSNDVPVQNNPYAVAIADFNGDGIQDLAVANTAGSSVSVRLGDGTGGFTGNSNTLLSGFPRWVATGDFNTDGKQDFMTVIDGANSVAIVLGVASEINVQGNNISITDGDDIPGLADHTDFGNLSNSLTRTFTIQNTGTQNLTINTISVTGADSSQFTKGGISLPATISGGASTTFTLTCTPTGGGLKTATVNIGNDDCDEAVYNFAVQATGVTPPPTIGNYPGTNIATAGGNVKITPSSAPTNTTSIMASVGTNFKGLLHVNPVTGVLSVTNAHPAGSYIVNLRAFNSSGTIATSSLILTVSNTTCSQGLFTGITNIPIGSEPYGIAIGDFNSDGNQDFAIVNNTGNNVSIRLGNGLGGFGGTSTVSVGNNPQSIAIRDLNGDGKADLATANRASNSVSIRLGDGTGNFSGSTEVLVGNSPESINISDFDRNGIPDFVTANYNSNTVSIRMGDGFGGFSGTTNIIVGNNPTALSVGDLNGDGNPDFATANISGNTVSVRFGDGSGNFSGTTELPVGGSPIAIAIGDFNNDLRQDISTANSSPGSNSVSIHLSNGSGGFTQSPNVPTGNNPRSIAIGDFNGDGKQDLAVGRILSGNNISIRLGDGLGGFTGTTEIIGVGIYPVSIAVADINNDGKQDLMTSNYALNSVGIVLGSANEINIQGNGTTIPDGDNTPSATDFTDFGSVISGGNIAKTFGIQNTGATPLTINTISFTGTDSARFTRSGITLPATVAPGVTTTFTVTFSPISSGLKTARVNIGNDDCDEAVYDFAIQGTGAAPSLGVYPATSILTAGKNTTVTPSAAPANTTGMIVSTSTSFKGILTANPATGVVTITNAYPAGTYTITIKAVNGTAFATTNFQLTVGNNLCSQGSFSTGNNISVGATPSTVGIGDFNGDGKQDLLTANSGVNNISIRLGDGLGSFTGSNSVQAGVKMHGITVCDFNNDGRQDFVTASYFLPSASIWVYLGNGSGGFTYNSFAVGNQPWAVATGDFNGDGNADIVTANKGNNIVTVTLGDGTGSFATSYGVPVGANPESIVVGDFNKDGKLDFATANTGSNDISVVLGNGTGGFGSPVSVATGTTPRELTMGDFNNDGNQDFATANDGSSTVSIRLGDGLGGFAVTTDFTVGANPHCIVTGDFNGDGKADIATASFTTNTVSVSTGYGNGYFNTITGPPVGSVPESIAIGDFNSDGRFDFVTANNSSDNVSIRLGSTNEINVMGNNTTINDGDNTPSAGDFTDFGATGTSNSIARIFTIQNTGTGNLAINNLSFTGANASMFTLSGISLPVTVASGSSTTFNVTFSPTTTGLKTAIISIGNDDCDESVYDFAIQGTGANPPVLGNYPAITIITAGLNAKVTPAAAPTNTASITAFTSSKFKGILNVNPATGVVSITNAHPAGVYTITVKAFNGTSNATSNFIITVQNPYCSPGKFTGSVSTDPQTLTSPRTVTVCDFNNDGKQDFMVPDITNGKIHVLVGNGNGGYTTGTAVILGANPYSIIVADFNGDGNQDFAVTCSGTNNVIIRFGNGTGGFTGTTSLSVGNVNADRLVSGNFNNDGIADFAVLNRVDGIISVRTANGSGGFNSYPDINLGMAAGDFAVGDVNNDGNDDIVVTRWSLNTVSSYLGTGAGNFTAGGSVSVGFTPDALALTDFNNDGALDLVTNNKNENSVSIRLGNGAGGYTGSFDLQLFDMGLALTTGDFTGDGKQDVGVVVADNFNSRVQVYKGDGAGGLALTSYVSIGSVAEYYAAVAVGDFNSDGRMDLVTNNYYSQSISIRLGNPTEINVKGNNIDITDGDNSPSLSDYTDFGNGNLITRSFIIQNTGITNLFLDTITVTGADSAMFKIGPIIPNASISPGQSYPVNITFTPTSPGVKKATINIINDDCDEATYDFVIQGGMLAGALDFDGINDHIVINNTIGNIGTSDATLSAWVKTTSSGIIIGNKNICNTGNYFSLDVTPNGELSARFTDSLSTNQFVVSNALVYDGLWHHVAAVRKGSSLSLYVDGLLNGTTISADTAVIYSTEKMVIGGSVCNFSPNFFAGQMDELKFYNRALTACEIQNTMRCEMSGNQTGLLLYYKFNQSRALDNNSTATTLTDSSGNTNNGTLTNFALTGSTSNWVAQGAVTTGTVCSDTNSWLGTTAAWNLPSNWSKGFVPLECTKVVINAGVPNMPQITSPVSTCFSLKLNNGATVTVKGSGKLDITGK